MEDRGSNGLGRPSIFRHGSVRRLDVVHVHIGDLNLFRLELPTETCAIKTGTEDSRFICIDVNCNLVLSCSRLHGLLNHRRSRSATSKNDRRHIFLKKTVELAREGGIRPKRTNDRPALAKQV